MLDRIRTYYGIEAHGTNFRREVIAGLTAFMTMSYIIVVNPAILEAGGIPPAGHQWWLRSSRRYSARC